MNDEIDPTDSDSTNSGEIPPPPPPLFGETPGEPQAPQEPPQPGITEPFVQPGSTPPPPPEYQAPAQGTYYSNTQGYNVAGPKNDPFAITSLSTGIPSIILMCCCGPLGGVVGVIATVFGFLSLGRIDKSDGQLVGKGMAIGGLTCGIIGIVLGFGYFILNIIFGFGNFSYYNY